jgi:hypothetical protein
MDEPQSEVEAVAYLLARGFVVRTIEHLVVACESQTINADDRRVMRWLSRWHGYREKKK